MNKKYFLVILISVSFCEVCFAQGEGTFDLSGKVASFEKAHKVIQTSCMPCHSAQLPLPWYGRLPMIKKKMKKDYLNAIDGLNLDSQVYVAGQAPSADALNKIEMTLEKGTMPPRSYVIKHLSARISKQEKQAILDWIRDERTQTQRPVPAQILPQLPLQITEPVSSNSVKEAAMSSAVGPAEANSSTPVKHTNPFKPFKS